MHRINNSSYDSGHFNKVLHYLNNCSGSRFDWTSAASGLQPAEHIKTIASECFNKGDWLNITPARGDPQLLKTIENYFHNCGIDCKEENLLISPSTFQIISGVYDLKHPKTVLMPSPSFGHFAVQCQERGIRTALLPTDETNDWKITPKSLERAITINKPSIFLLTNPANPTGVVYTKHEIEQFAAVLKHHNILTIVDEVFRDVVLNPNQRPYSLAAVDGMQDKVITLNGVGKSRGLPSMFVSFCAAPKNIVTELTKTHTVSVGQTKLQQSIAKESMIDNQENREYLINNAEKYLNNCFLIKKLITNLDNSLKEDFGGGGQYVKPVIEVPDATNVYLIDFMGLKNKSIGRKKLTTGLDVAEFLQKEAGVAMVPYEGFLMDKSSMILRMCTSRSPEELQQGFAAISEACQKLTSQQQHLGFMNYLHNTKPSNGTFMR